MKKITEEIYSRIDNEFYDGGSEMWWELDSPLSLMKSSVNPLRVGYTKRVLDKLRIDPRGKTALEVGCGGGVLTEEIARMGFVTTGIDPSVSSLTVASRHARLNSLSIRYEKGTGEDIPHADNSSDFVFCCDTLEHVRDVSRTISEISRVLKPGGLFFYDTLNRTWYSRLVAIKIAQEWKRWAFMPPRLHVWEMFIKPSELITLLRHNNLEWREHCGIEPAVSVLRILHYLRKRVKGELTYRDVGNRLPLVESNNTNIMYIGYAMKPESAFYPRHV